MANPVRVRTSSGWQDLALQGEPGEKWFSSAGAPAGGTGVVGDWHLNSANGDVSEKTGASTWTVRGNIQGPQGIQGPTGPTGSTGPEGPEGDPGTMEVYVQAAQPASTTDGAVWIDTDESPPSWEAQIPLVTSLPGSPYDTQEVFYLANATLGIVWHLRYRAASASWYKWECVGGPALYHEVTNTEALNVSAAYGAFGGSAGPTLTVPLAGDYEISHGFTHDAAGYNTAFMSYDIGATGAVDADAVRLPGIYPASDTTGSRTRRKTFDMGVVLLAKYRNSVTLATTFSDRWMRIAPIRVADTNPPP